MAEDGETNSRLIQSLTSIGAAGVGSLAGLGIAGPPGAIVGAVGIQTALELTGQLWEQIGHRRRLNATVPIAYVAAELHQPLDEVTERLAYDPALGPITATVLLGAASTQRHDKLWALGRVLANVVQDQARVDEEQFIASALNAIEAPHIRLLDHLERRQAANSGQLVSQYSFELAQLGTAFNSVLKTLETAGLIGQQPISETRNGPMPRFNLPNSEGPPKIQVVTLHWGMTDLGKLVMERLHQAAQEIADSDGTAGQP